MIVLLWICAAVCFAATSVKGDTCKQEFEKLLRYTPIGGSEPANRRAFIYYVSMAKHMYDIGNYQYCTEKGQDYDLKYALLALRVADEQDNDRFIYGGCCVPSSCSEDEIRDGNQEGFEKQYSSVYYESKGLLVSFPSDKSQSVDALTIIGIAIWSVVCILVIFGTVVDKTSLCSRASIVEPPSSPNQEGEGDDRRVTAQKTKLGLFLSSFSVPLNFSRIFIESSTIQKELNVFNGLFVLSLILVILNNVYFVSAMYGIVEASKLTEYETQFPQFIFLRLSLAYEIFYFCIGFTSCVKLWTNFFKCSQRGSVAFELLRLAYRRFIPIAFLLAGVIFLFPHFGYGPLYQF